MECGSLTAAASTRPVFLPPSDFRKAQYMKPALVIAAVLVALALTYSWFQKSKRTTEEFAGHLNHERYEEAALMLSAPSALEVAPDGALTLVDNAGKSTTVSAAKLPSIVGGQDGALDHDFKMTAPGSSTNGGARHTCGDPLPQRRRWEGPHRGRGLLRQGKL